jgi:hypothetical protein
MFIQFIGTKEKGCGFKVFKYLSSALLAEPDGVVAERVQQSDRRGSGTPRGEPAAPAQPRPQLVSARHRQRARIHRL